MLLIHPLRVLLAITWLLLSIDLPHLRAFSG
jgi:hypothetical protein